MSINITLYRMIIVKYKMYIKAVYCKTSYNDSWSNCVKDIADPHAIDITDDSIPSGAESQLRPERQRQRPVPALRPHQ